MINSGKMITVQSIKNGMWIADKCHVAETFFERLRGLIGTQSFREGEGLLLRRCNDIHMWWMSIPIDVVFIRPKDATTREVFQVTSLRENMRPWKLLPSRDGRAEETLELPIGTIQRCSVKVGDELCIS